MWLYERGGANPLGNARIACPNCHGVNYRPAPESAPEPLTVIGRRSIPPTLQETAMSDPWQSVDPFVGQNAERRALFARLGLGDNPDVHHVIKLLLDRIEALEQRLAADERGQTP